MKSKKIRSDVETFLQSFERLKFDFLRVKQEALETARKTAPNFNVFSLLGLSRYETRTHSAMLAYLLNPGAGHGQQFLFLDSFLYLCVKKFPDFPLPDGKIDTGRWETLTEQVTSFGRLDIVVRSPDLNYLLVIENKIDAIERSYQLQRYATWMETQREEYPTQALIYLTIYGQSATTASSGLSYFKLSYRTDIGSFLAKAIPQIQASNVMEVTKQYHALILKI